MKQKLKFLNPAKLNQLISEGGFNAVAMMGGMNDSEDDGGADNVASPEGAMRKGKGLIKKAKKKSASGAGQMGGPKKYNNFMDK